MKLPADSFANEGDFLMTFIAKHLSVSIERSAAEVHEFASDPENLPQWAEGLSGSIKKIETNG